MWRYTRGVWQHGIIWCGDTAFVTMGVPASTTSTSPVACMQLLQQQCATFTRGAAVSTMYVLARPSTHQACCC
jgi:hypothetical protein